MSDVETAESHRQLGRRARANAAVLGRLPDGAAMGFGRTSALRRFAGEPALALLIMRALVLEVAHTRVGAGVTDHSRFTRIPVRRLLTTVDAGFRLIWGDDRIARGAAEQVYRFHDGVHGTLPDDVADGGATYTAHDATLLLWVWATLVDTIECAAERYVGPLGESDHDALYDDLMSFARFFGIPDELVPADRDAFTRYYQSVLEGDALGTSPQALRMVRNVLWFDHWMVPSAVVSIFRAFAIGTLPPVAAERLDLRLEGRDQRTFERIDGLLVRHYRKLPAVRRMVPRVWVTLRRPLLRRNLAAAGPPR